MRILLRPVLALLAALFASAGLIACGSSGGSSSQDANALLKQTFGGSHKIQSGKLDVKANLDLQGVKGSNGPITLSLAGPFQKQGAKQLPRFDLKFSFSGGGQTFSAGATSTGQQGFVSFQNSTYSIDQRYFDVFKRAYQQAAVKSAGQKGSAGFSAAGVDPRNWLSNPKVEGDADVEGAKTTHISSGVDVGRLVDDIDKLVAKAQKSGVAQAQSLPSQLTPAARKKLVDAVKEAHVDIYTGKGDKILREMTIKLKVDAGNGRSGNLEVDFGIADLNSPQTISAPANAKPFSELQSALGGLSGILGGGSSGGLGGSSSRGSSSGGTSAGGAASPQAKAYLACVQKATTDAARSACLSKLTK